jgi:dolichyl-diphosphooligosaccharide--protein glycosyltransferase
MRKRAQRRVKPEAFGQKIDTQRTQIRDNKKLIKFNKNWWIALSLVSIFLLVLFFNSYFNVTSEVAINPEGEGFDKFLLSGPDPYYNMRLVEVTYETGTYPFYSEPDPLLNYPLGRSGGRPPLFNMMALGFSRLLTPFMSEIDAIGYSMQFIPALFGALLIFPVYLIGKEVFNKKAGLIAALFVPIIAIHVSSGHGSAYSLFDHDSFNLLLFFITFLFLIKSIKSKDSMKSFLYALLAGVPLAALNMTWVQARYLYVVIAVYAIVQMIIDIYTNKINKNIPLSTSVTLLSGYLISIPVISSWKGFQFDVNLFLCLGVLLFGVIYYVLDKKKIPWTLSLPAFFSIGALVLVLLYFIDSASKVIKFISPLRKISEVIFGSGIYGDKVDMTIAEANTYTISQSVIPFGPAFYWLGWTGLIFLFYLYYKNNNRRDYLFMIVLFIITVWLTGVAGRFTNDMVPLVAILGGWVVWVTVDKIDYKQMIRNVRSAGGGIHGIRRGVNLLHVFGILFIAFLVVLPNAYIAFDAAIPAVRTEEGSTLKEDMFGEDHTGLYGLGIGKELYWGDAFSWLNEQDQDIADPADRPGFISWWDYGFYAVAIGGHPTVADNFQDGIPPASNFHTSTNEKEAVAVWIARLIEGNEKQNRGKVSQEVKDVLERYIGVNDTNNLVRWVEDPFSSPSYNSPIASQYDKALSKDYRVGEQWPVNAFYHDIVRFLTTDELVDSTENMTGIALTDEEITWLYHDIQDATGYSIRYYGVEGYDRQIFNIFAFLSDKSLLLLSQGGQYNPEDDFSWVEFVSESGRSYTFDELKNLTNDQLRQDPIVDTKTNYKDAYYNTMFFKTYFGFNEPGDSLFKIQVPCVDMKHFYGEYLSDLSEYQYYSGIGAVVIAKYYEGAYINGSVNFMGEPLDAQVAITKDLTYYENVSFPIDHDKVDTSNGNFSLIAGAGNITLQVRRYPELHSSIPWASGDFILKNVVFNSTTNPDLYPISDDDAMRKSDSYERYLNISVDPANLSGCIYIDKDDDGSYNSSVDNIIPGSTVTLREVYKLQISATGSIQTDTSVPYGSPVTSMSDESGYYNFSNLIPGYYVIEVTIDDIPTERSLIPLVSGNTSINLSKPELSAIEGTVYYDENNNTEYDSGDKIIGDADVEIYHDGKLINKTTSDSDTGVYSFTSLIPGQRLLQDGSYYPISEYTIKASKSDSYVYESTVSPEENKTMSFNISMELASINLTGYAEYDAEPVESVEIDFMVDKSEENNTAKSLSVESNDDGFYEVSLSPGSYNITLRKYEGDTVVYELTGEKLVLGIGQEPVARDFNLNKISSSVSGFTKYNGNNIENISIDFEPLNQSGTPASALSDETGEYSVELATGNYNVIVNQEMNVSGELFNYTFSGELEIPADNSAMPKYNIVIAKEAAES